MAKYIGSKGEVQIPERIGTTSRQETDQQVSEWLRVLIWGVSADEIVSRKLENESAELYIFDDKGKLIPAIGEEEKLNDRMVGKRLLEHAQGGQLFIGEDAVLDVANVADQDVMVGIRPEGFELAEDGKLSCALSNVEVMGRDVSIVSTNSASANPVVRSIINADNKVDITLQTVRFNLKPHKVFLFNKETEERINFEVK